MGTVPYYKKELGGATFAIAKELYDMGADMRRAGSAAIDLSYVAAGRNDLFFELILSPWDYAAAQLIVKEAGGIVSDIYGNEVDVTKPCSVIAANREIYDILLGVTEKY
jgi:myo-inositol-1(or 4)-monophosphatase